MSERMTWSEIAKTYPNQWVGLTDVEREPDNYSTIKSAVVLYTDRSKDDLLLEQIQTNGKTVARYTNPNALFQLGVLG
ncbi:MAG: hypothetical protein IJJ79_06050 [Lachnospiraceae bacterium]|nr:hypothetical protein [Lachnospiraceae bacterium]